jgi:hypothetical protein
MLKPDYKITLGNTVLSRDMLGPLVTLQVKRCKNGAADEACVFVGRVPAVSASKGDEVTVELGWEDGAETVFTGAVEAVADGVAETEIVCLSGMVKLARARGDRAFVNQSAGKVVKALADDAGVETETIEDGIDLPVYFADSTHSFYSHAAVLRRRCGFDLYINEEGKLVFARFAASVADHTFRYGEQIIDAAVEKGTPLESVLVIPESPASSSGADTASWIVKDPASHQVTAGSGAVGLILSDALLKTKDAADTAANARLSFSQRDAVFGHVELMGYPAVKLGQAVALKGVPDEGVDGTYQVMSVRHRLDRRNGFRTTVGLGGMPSSGLGGLL